MSSEIRDKSIRSLSWVAVAQLARGALLFLAPALLANFLSAGEMGTAEIALAVFALALMFIELGTGPAVIQRPELTHCFLSTVFVVNVATGLLFSLAFFAAAPVIARLLGMDPSLVRLIRGMSTNFVLVSLAIVQRNLLVRRMRFRAIAVVQGSAGIVAVAVVAFALSRGLGLGSILFAVWAYVACSTLGFWIAGDWWPSLEFDRRELGSLLRFSVAVSAASTVNNIGVQLERFLIGGVLGAASLGVYGLARNLILVPSRQLMKISDTIVFPAMASLQGDEERCRDYYLTAVRYELAVLGPLVVVISVFAGELVSLAYGPGWRTTALIVPLLAPLAWRQITAHTIGAVFLSQGRPDVQLRWALYSLPLKAAYFLIGMAWGPAGVALSLSICGVGGWAIGHTMANRLIGLRFARFLRALIPPLACHGLLAAALLAIKWGAETRAAISPLTWIVIAAPLALAIYAPLLRLIDPALLAGVQRLVVAALRGHGRGPATVSDGGAGPGSAPAS